MRYYNDKEKDLQGCPVRKPVRSRDAALAYLESEDDLLEWFLQNYEQREVLAHNKRFKYYVSTKDIYNHYKESSDFWQHTSKDEKRRFNLKRFEDDLRTNHSLQTSFRDAKKEKCIAWMNKVTCSWGRSENYNSSRGVVGWRPIFDVHNNKVDYSDEAEATRWAEVESI